MVGDLDLPCASRVPFREQANARIVRCRQRDAAPRPYVALVLQPGVHVGKDPLREQIGSQAHIDPAVLQRRSELLRPANVWIAAGMKWKCLGHFMLVKFADFFAQQQSPRTQQAQGSLDAFGRAGDGSA